MGLHNESLAVLLTVLVCIGDMVWLITDPRVRKDRWQRKISLTYPRVTLALLPQIIIGLICPWPSTTWNGIFAVIGTGMLVTGLCLALWTRAVMGRAWAPPDAHDIAQQDRLITAAPFSITRNPIYVGVCFMVLGFTVAVRKLGHFGDRYQQYKASVPRF